MLAAAEVTKNNSEAIAVNSYDQIVDEVMKIAMMVLRKNSMTIALVA
jgi:hypothetical protein